MGASLLYLGVAVWHSVDRHVTLTQLASLNERANRDQRRSHGRQDTFRRVAWRCVELNGVGNDAPARVPLPRHNQVPRRQHLHRLGLLFRRGGYDGKGTTFVVSHPMLQQRKAQRTPRTLGSSVGGRPPEDATPLRRLDLPGHLQAVKGGRVQRVAHECSHRSRRRTHLGHRLEQQRALCSREQLGLGANDVLLHRDVSPVVVGAVHGEVRVKRRSQNVPQRTAVHVSDRCSSLVKGGPV
mmetsp:Transcript_9348/g.29739  ORF Transcript_9348/g.29739 Transcript_9348/m.29739 type:complete len:240 (+) Transcript_9348:591-1310(+)